jgi:signal transduction histidine kinase/ActR/RegA family two-component response regulator
MKIRRKLALILFTGVACMVILSFLFFIIINRENNKLLKEKLTETKNIEVPKALSLNTAQIKNSCFDYTVWDQMVEYIKNPKDTTWAKEEIDDPLIVYKVDYAWVIDSDLKEVYSSSPTHNRPIKQLNIDSDILKKELYKDYFRHFYINDSNKIIEIFAAPIQPTADIERKTKPYGFMLLGTILDSSYFKKLRNIDEEIKITLVGKENSIEDQTSSSSGNVSFSVPLKDISNNTIGILAVEKSYPVLVSNRNFLKRYLTIFIFLLLFISVIFLQVTRRMLFKPLHSITTAIADNTPEKIIPLSNSKTEYGDLSKLVINFFKQRDILNNEIEQRKETEVALKKSIEEKETAIIDKVKAEQSALAKSEFLSVMSHEIRTPINGVIGISNLLLDEQLNDKQKEYVKTLHFSAQHLLSLVSDILDFSKIESGSFELERTSFNLDRLCHHVYDLYKGKASEKGIDYNYTPAATNEYSMYGDPTRLSQVLSNLLSNAIKFTDKGSVDFSYTVKEENNHNAIIVFKVKDSGIGIEKDKQSKIFESFSQADQSVTRKYGGTGLGLTISKKLIELQGGCVSVNSVHGSGSEFIITLPLDKHVYTDKEALEKNIQKTVSESLKGMKILVAEDNTINAMVLTRFLDKWNTEYKVAKDGAEAVTLAQNEEFDIILMDLQMPVMDGEEATSILRKSEDERVSKIPIVAFTADALIDNHRKLLKVGFDHCITKPFNPDALLKYLKQHHTNVA